MFYTAARNLESFQCVSFGLSTCSIMSILILELLFNNDSLLVVKGKKISESVFYVLYMHVLEN